jgi:hypothetical protein
MGISQSFVFLTHLKPTKATLCVQVWILNASLYCLEPSNGIPQKYQDNCK